MSSRTTNGKSMTTSTPRPTRGSAAHRAQQLASRRAVLEREAQAQREALVQSFEDLVPKRALAWAAGASVIAARLLAERRSTWVVGGSLLAKLIASRRRRAAKPD
jgi:hypothetical protein